MKAALWRWGPLVAYMVAIFALSAQSVLPRVGPDTYAHFFEYAILGALAARAIGGALLAVDGSVAAKSFVLSLAYGATDEIHQRYVPGREASFKDLRMDALGAAAAVLILWGTSRARARRREEAG